MAANIFGERFVGRQTAWHQLGTVFGDDANLTMTEAMQLGGLDYNVRLAPLTAAVKLEGTDLFGVELNRAKTIHIDVPNQFAIVREPTVDDPEPRIFGTVSDTYEIIQNSSIASIMDQLVDDWPVETAGALGKGETVFFTLKVGGTDIRGDEIDQFFLISDSKTGKSACKIAFVGLRVVCQNTLTAALGSAKVLSFMNHIAGVNGALEHRVSLLKELNHLRDRTILDFNKLAEVVLTDEQIDAVFEAAYPEPTKPSEVALFDRMEDDSPEDINLMTALFSKVDSKRQRWLYYKDRAVTMRNDAKVELAKINDEELEHLPHLQNTAWAAWQAITGREDHREGPEGMYESALFGQRAATKIRAFKQAMAFVR